MDQSARGSKSVELLQTALHCVHSSVFFLFSQDKIWMKVLMTAEVLVEGGGFRLKLM